MSAVKRSRARPERRSVDRIVPDSPTPAGSGDELPPAAGDADVLRLLERAGAGDLHASEELFVVLYDALRRYASVVMRAQPAGHTLTPTALVNEAFLRLAGREGSFNDRTHFVRVAARAMRQVLVDHARRRRRRDAALPQSHVANTLFVSFDDAAIDMIALDEALVRLAQVDAQSEQIVELRFLGGLSLPEVAKLLDVPLRTVERRWTFARAWLHAELN